MTPEYDSVRLDIKNIYVYIYINVHVQVFFDIQVVNINPLIVVLTILLLGVPSFPTLCGHGVP